MSKDLFTPGPWFVGRMLDPKNAPCVIGDGDTVVAILPGEWNGCTYIKGDAVLAAAAPDLLWALRNLSAIVDAAILSGDWKVDGACDPDMDIAAARAAIAKARGDA